MVSRSKRTDYGLVSCQYERDVIAGIDRRYKRERHAKIRRGVTYENRKLGY